MGPNINLEEKNALLHAFGDNLKRIRESKNLTQEDIAYTAGFSRSYYTEVEQGKRNPSLLNINRLANALEVSLLVLLDLDYGKKG